jgi:RNA polymerase sigma-70 factor (ECF subfamily)
MQAASIGQAPTLTSASRRRPAVEDLCVSIARIAAGDSDAFARLFDTTARLVYALAARILRRPEEAEEVMIDVYSQVWQDASGYDSRRGSVEAWLITITRSRALDRLRLRLVRPDLNGAALAGLDEVSDEWQAASATRSQEALWRVNAALPVLAPEERRLIELAFFEGYTHRELSSVLHLPLGTVKTRIRTSLHKMRRALLARERW